MKCGWRLISRVGNYGSLFHTSAYVAPFNTAGVMGVLSGKPKWQITRYNVKKTVTVSKLEQLEPSRAIYQMRGVLIQKKYRDMAYLDITI